MLSLIVIVSLLAPVLGSLARFAVRVLRKLGRLVFFGALAAFLLGEARNARARR